MPVSQLLCEGENNSPDVRVLSKLLSGLCEIKPNGGKYGMGVKIIARREVLGKTSVFGILDGDFLKDWQEPENRPAEWKSGNLEHFGWRWERKEIENYLIDPVVVEKALKNENIDMTGYRTALEDARDRISDYQAAGTALSANRIDFRPLPSSFGKERGKERHRFPENFDRESCKNGILKTVERHGENQTVQLAEVISSFELYCNECEKDGRRHNHYLYYFAGKDLFQAMKGWFIEKGFQSHLAFREKILTGIQKTTDDIASWLPEWENLRSTIIRL